MVNLVSRKLLIFFGSCAYYSNNFFIVFNLVTEMKCSLLHISIN